MLYLYTAIDHLKPRLKDLVNIVAPKVSAKWFELGIQLLDDSQLPKLEEILAVHTKNYDRGCIEMLKYWLHVDKEATWGKIIEALKAPGLQIPTVSQNVNEEAKGAYCILS